MDTSMFRPVWEEQRGDSGIRLSSLWQVMGWPNGELGLEVSGAIRCPDWPPDLFALVAAALRKSGAYTLPIRHLEKSLAGNTFDDIAGEWKKCVNQFIETGEPYCLPASVAERWRFVANEQVLNLPLSRLLDDKEVAAALIILAGIADETCAGVGLPFGDHGTALRRCADQLLFPSQFGSTLCRYVHPSAGRVLPKMHTPQCGLTMRSFSHHLAFCETDEVQPAWLSVPGARGDVNNTHHLNILIAPWPEVITPAQIRPSSSQQGSKDYRCFDFNVASSQLKLAAKLQAMAGEAEKIVGSLDAVIMPELSLSTYDYRAARAAMLRKGLLFICGVGTRNENRVNIDVPLSKYHAVHLRQRKHHRWKIDEAQIRQYGLGARLNPAHNYWERIAVEDRKLIFLVLRPWLVTTALICEDLARHDPVGELIRGIGPNLVIALLMDGPQLTGRWASRYAAGLADDPGSSVLSVTSLGMAELSRPSDGNSTPSRVAALWKDAFCGKPVELTVPPGHSGLVITLAVKRATEQTADLRTDRDMSSFPVLVGVHPVKIPDQKPDLVNDDLKTNWISPYQAFLLARLAQRSGLKSSVAPEELSELSDQAYRIGRELWKLKAGDESKANSEAGESTVEECATAREILEWHDTNTRPV